MNRSEEMTTSPLTAILALACSLAAAAQFPQAAPADELRQRRQAVFERIEDGVAIIPGALREPSYVEFRQSNRFYYLTGLEIPDAYLILDGKNDAAILCMPLQTRSRDMIEGPIHGGASAVKIASGVDRVIDSKGEMEKVLDGLIGNKKRVIWTPWAPEEIGPMINDSAQPAWRARTRSGFERFKAREAAFVELLQERYPKADLRDLSGAIRQLRAVKSDWEIERVATATRISARAMVEVIKAARPGIHEYQLGAISIFEGQKLGAQGAAYYPIVGSGPNSCVVHYWKKNRQLVDGDMIVVDAASSYGYYVSDITRSFPANGKFSAEQRRVYEAVLEAQEACIAEAGPGVPISAMNRIARKVLKKHGLARYLPHGVTHHVGMAVHDPRSRGKLRPGHVITIEPGAYLREKALGVRIEDVVLITKDGNRVLSDDVPKTIAEIESTLR